MSGCQVAITGPITSGAMMVMLRNVLIFITFTATSLQLNAEQIRFNLTGDYAASWIMDSDPFPRDPVHGVLFGLFDVEGSFSMASTNFVDLYFFNTAVGGGLQLVDYNGSGEDLIATDSLEQLYSGNEFSPHFSSGKFFLTDHSGSDKTFILQISNIPEPSSQLLFLIGVAALAVRRILQGALVPTN